MAAITAHREILQQAYKDIVNAMHCLKNTIKTACKGDTIVSAPTILERILLQVELGGTIVSNHRSVYTKLQALHNRAPDTVLKYCKQDGRGVDTIQQHNMNERIEDAFQECLLRRIDLATGGYIIFDQTETLTAIDVNGGGTNTLKEGDDALFALNVAAAKEIVRQIVLRNICGLIVIDFIRLRNRGRQQHIVKALVSQFLFYDPGGTWDVIGITRAGLVEVTRKRNRISVTELMVNTLSERPLNVQTAGLDILNRIVDTKGAGTPTIYAPREIIEAIKSGPLKSFRIQVENMLSKDIAFKETIEIHVAMQP